jgi:hypothetical protein
LPQTEKQDKRRGPFITESDALSDEVSLGRSTAIQ